MPVAPLDSETNEEMGKKLVEATGRFGLCKEDRLFWHAISDFSKWSYFFTLFTLVMHIRDWIFDGLLIYAFATEREWSALVETSIILVAASLFQVYHYQQEEKWMDANHRLLRTSSESEAVPPNEPVPSASFTNGNINHEPVVSFNGIPVTNPNSHPVPSTSASARAQLAAANGNGVCNGRNSSLSTTSSSAPVLLPNNENEVNESQSPSCCTTTCFNNSRFWRRTRCAAKLSVFGLPIFRAVANWRDLKQKEQVIEWRRANRMEVDEIEIAAAVTKSERDITEQTFQVLEQFFETLPQSVIQVCLAARVGETLRFDTWTDGIRRALIIISLLMSAFSSTKYFSDYCKHLKTLHFQDYTMFKHKVDLEVLDWTSCFLYFFMNLIVIVTRFYGISYIFVVYGQILGLIFITFLYLVQYTWLEVETSCRLMYENPPRGIVTNYSNGIDRWTNVFTFHMIKPNVRTIGFYNLIYLCCIAVFTMAANMLGLGTNNNVNVSSNQCSNSNFTYNYANSSQPTTIVFGNETDPDNSEETGISAQLFNYTNSTMLGNDTEGGAEGIPLTYYSMFSCFPYVLISWTLCTLACLTIGWSCALESRLQPFIRSQFPLSKGFPFWGRVMSCMKWEKVPLEWRRYVCICMLANDKEFMEGFNTFCFNIFCNMAPRGIREDELDRLWEKIIRRTPLSVDSNHTVLCLKWDDVKEEKKANQYMSGIIELVDSAFRDGQLENLVGELYVFLNLVKYFEKNLGERNSLRLQRTDQFLRKLKAKYDTKSKRINWIKITKQPLLPVSVSAVPQS